MEIHADDMNPNYFDPIWVIIDVNHHLDIPHELWISKMRGITREGCVAQVLSVWFWPRHK